ncbi:peptidase S59, nucleoporin [Tanacetum coccineum]
MNMFICCGNQATRSKSDTVKLISISAMPAYDTRSHEELRWDNYMTRKTTAPFNPFAINSSAVKSSSSIFPPFSSSPANNISTTSWPSTTTSPTWNYPAPIAFTSSNTSLTTTPSNSFNPFAINPSVKSTSSGFPPGSSLPVTTSWPSPGTTFPSLTSQPLHVSPSTNTTLTTDPSNSFNPFAPKTSLTSPASTFPFTPLSHTPFQIPSTSLPTQPSFSSFTYPSKAAWPTSVDGPFPMVPAATNSVTVSPVSCEPTPTCNQLSLSHITSTSAAASPFGILPPSPQLLICKYAFLQVKDKPAPVRYPLLTTRHFSRGGKLPIRKYDPKLSGPKIPYYSVTSEMPDTFFVPRENPRALIITREKSQPRENMHEEKLSGSMYEKERDGISADTGSEDPTNDLDLFATIVDVPSKLQQPDYYTEPQISELEAKERAEPGYCRRVKDFVVGRHGYGSIKFFGETDVRKLDLETLIQFNNREVIVYMDESKKPPVGEGLNIPAEVTLLNIKCINKKTGMQCVDGSKIDRYTAMLKKKAATQGAEFLSYEPVEGEWKFKVQHF